MLGNMEMVDWNQSPLHNSSDNGDENTRFPLLCSMKDTEKLLCSQSPASVFQNEVKTLKSDLKGSLMQTQRYIPLTHDSYPKSRNNEQNASINIYTCLGIWKW
jgi:hypothetical protein